jgi:CO/xanthine dehydrogenase Mo-binding subunit
MGANDTGYIGQSLRRKEDARFLHGAGQFTDDVSLAHQVHAYFLRSPHAHAKIRSIDAKKAKDAPGVLGVFTGNDLEGVNGLPCGWLITSVDGTPMKEPPHYVLAKDKVRYVGDHVALVVAETLNEAKDAAELINVDYDVLPAVVNAVDALKSGAPQAARRRARQQVLHVGARRQGRGRRGVLQGRARDQARHRQQPADPECDRAARGDGVVSEVRRFVHALRDQPEPARRAPADDLRSCSDCPSTRSA